MHQDLLAQHAAFAVARDLPHDHDLVGEFVRCDPPLLEKPVERIERDRLVRKRHHGGNDAVSGLGIWNHETGGVEESGEASVKLVELGGRDRKPAVTEKFGISLKLKGRAVHPVGLAEKPGSDKAVAVWRKRSIGLLVGNDRPAQNNLAVSIGIALWRKLRLDEDGVFLAILDFDGAQGKRSGLIRPLAHEHNAGEIAERIEVEE